MMKSKRKTEAEIRCYQVQVRTAVMRGCLRYNLDVVAVSSVLGRRCSRFSVAPLKSEQRRGGRYTERLHDSL